MGAAKHLKSLTIKTFSRRSGSIPILVLSGSCRGWDPGLILSACRLRWGTGLILSGSGPGWRPDPILSASGLRWAKSDSSASRLRWGPGLILSASGLRLQCRGAFQWPTRVERRSLFLLKNEDTAAPKKRHAAVARSASRHCGVQYSSSFVPEQELRPLHTKRRNRGIVLQVAMAA